MGLTKGMVVECVAPPSYYSHWVGRLFRVATDEKAGLITLTSGTALDLYSWRFKSVSEDRLVAQGDRVVPRVPGTRPHLGVVEYATKEEFALVGVSGTMKQGTYRVAPDFKTGDKVVLVDDLGLGENTRLRLGETYFVNRCEDDLVELVGRLGVKYRAFRFDYASKAAEYEEVLAPIRFLRAMEKMAMAREKPFARPKPNVVSETGAPIPFFEAPILINGEAVKVADTGPYKPDPRVADFVDDYKPDPQTAASVFDQKQKALGDDTKDTNPKDAAASNRLDMSLFPATAIAYGALAMTEGHFKYGGYNWREAGVLASVYYSALMRHIMKWFNGEESDPKTGVPHLANALACIAILIDAHECGMLKDDRPPRAPMAEMLAQMESDVANLRQMYPNGPGRKTEWGMK